MEEKENKTVSQKLIEEVESEISKVCEEGIEQNIAYLSQLVDIHKDIDNEDYWKTKNEEIKMRYSNYGRDSYNDGSYGRRSRDSRGRYTENYGRRGVPGTGRGRYRGHDMLDDVYETYSDYMDDQEYGNYGTSESMMKIEVMADSLMDFVEHLKKEAKSPEEKQLIERKLQELGRM